MLHTSSKIELHNEKLFTKRNSNLFCIGGVQQVDPKKNGNSTHRSGESHGSNFKPVAAHLYTVSESEKKITSTIKMKGEREYLKFKFRTHQRAFLLQPPQTKTPTTSSQLKCFQRRREKSHLISQLCIQHAAVASRN